MPLFELLSAYKAPQPTRYSSHGHLHNPVYRYARTRAKWSLMLCAQQLTSGTSHIDWQCFKPAGGHLFTTTQKQRCQNYAICSNYLSDEFTPSFLMLVTHYKSLFLRSAPWYPYPVQMSTTNRYKCSFVPTAIGLLDTPLHFILRWNEL